MLDAEKLFKMFADQQTLDEIALQMPYAKNKTISILVRTKTGGGGKAGNSSKHGCSIKATIEGSSYLFPVPTKSYNDLKQTDKTLSILNDTKSKLSNRVAFNTIMSFIYDNQMAIIALWFSDGERTKIGDAIIDYLNNQLSSNDYTKLKLKAKDQTELNHDKDMVTKYVQEKLKDTTTVLYFGA